MKYSLAGHSCVQEVDNMHKQIEDAMRVAEFYSPISFLRVLLKVNRNQPYRVIQMPKKDFMDFMNASKLLKYNMVPYSKVFQLSFTKADLHCISYKLSHGEQAFQAANISNTNTRKIRKKKQRQSNADSDRGHGAGFKEDYYSITETEVREGTSTSKERRLDFNDEVHASH